MSKKSLLSRLLLIWDTDTEDTAEPRKPKSNKKAKAERRREESAAVWREIMQDEDELDDDEF